MSAVYDYNNYLAKSGVGMDAAGRFTAGDSEFGMYPSPRETAKARQTKAEMELRAMREAPVEMRIRQMLDDMRQRALAMGMGPGTIRLAPQELAVGGGSQSLTYSPTFGK